MTLARKNQVCLEATPYYHLMNRCVRRSFLCGYDKLTKTDYSHRKQWILDRIKYLVDSFAIRVCAYAIMDNHYHLVICVDSTNAEQWTADEVLARYGRIHSTKHIRDLLDNKADLTTEQRNRIDQTIKTWRERLKSISWFEKSLNEPIARSANLEDKVNGRFWQGRFKSQALLDEAALITCMAYVDLNPMRAGITNSLETSDFTSIQARMRRYLSEQNVKPMTQSKSDGSNTPKNRMERNTKASTSKKTTTNTSNTRGLSYHESSKPIDNPVFVPLVPLRDQAKARDNSFHLPISHPQYFLLLEVTGRQIQEGTSANLHDKAIPILYILGINPEYWVDSLKDFENRFPGAVGATEAIQSYLVKLTNRCRCAGASDCKALFTTHAPCH